MLVGVGGSWRVFLGVGGCWWVLVGVGGSWWMLVGVGGCWWVLVGDITFLYGLIFKLKDKFNLLCLQ